jgi:hypothetical protein
MRSRWVIACESSIAGFSSDNTSSISAGIHGITPDRF